MREYTFTVPGGQPEKKIEAMSLKKAMKSFQDDKAKEVTVEWICKKGNISFYSYKLPYKTRKERKGKL